MEMSHVAQSSLAFDASIGGGGVPGGIFWFGMYARCTILKAAAKLRELEWVAVNVEFQ